MRIAIGSPAASIEDEKRAAFTDRRDEIDRFPEHAPHDGLGDSLTRRERPNILRTIIDSIPCPSHPSYGSPERDEPEGREGHENRNGKRGEKIGRQQPSGYRSESTETGGGVHRNTLPDGSIEANRFAVTRVGFQQ